MLPIDDPMGDRRLEQKIGHKKRLLSLFSSLSVTIFFAVTIFFGIFFATGRPVAVKPPSCSV